MNERVRAWTDTDEGKKLQCMVFQFVYEWRKKDLEYGDSKYEWMGEKYIINKFLQSNPTAKREDVYAALARLVEHGYMISQYFTRYEDFRITKKGWDSWEKRISKMKGVS